MLILDIIMMIFLFGFFNTHDVKSDESNDEPVRKKEIKGGLITKSEYQSQYTIPKSQKNLLHGSIKNKSDAKLNDKYTIKKKTIFDRDNAEETKTTDTSLGAVIF